jgi:hypothetical protein
MLCYVPPGLGTFSRLDSKTAGFWDKISRRRPFAGGPRSGELFLPDSIVHLPARSEINFPATAAKGRVQNPFISVNLCAVSGSC